MMGMRRTIKNAVEKFRRSCKEINGDPMLIVKIALNFSS